MTGHFSLGRDHLIVIVHPRPELPLLFTAGILAQELTYACNFTGWSRDEDLGLRKRGSVGNLEIGPKMCANILKIGRVLMRCALMNVLLEMKCGK